MFVFCLMSYVLCCCVCVQRLNSLIAMCALVFQFLGVCSAKAGEVKILKTWRDNKGVAAKQEFFISSAWMFALNEYVTEHWILFSLRNWGLSTLTDLTDKLFESTINAALKRHYKAQYEFFMLQRLAAYFVRDRNYFILLLQRHSIFDSAVTCLEEWIPKSVPLLQALPKKSLFDALGLCLQRFSIIQEFRWAQHDLSPSQDKLPAVMMFNPYQEYFDFSIFADM